MLVLGDVWSGLGSALSPSNVLYVFIGVLVGTLIGALPGLGPAATIAMLLPISYSLPAEGAIIMLAGIYYGAMYGGRISSILVNLPGDAAAVVTTFDGYPMTKQGRGGAALTISAVASFVGGTLAALVLTAFAPILATFALQFGPPEIAALTTLGVLLAAYLGGKSTSKNIIAAGTGVLLASIGLDPIAGSPRLTFGSSFLWDGLNFVAVAMGVFGIGEILYNLEQFKKSGVEQKHKREDGLGFSVTRVFPTLGDWVQSRAAMVRGSVVGTLVGMAPGAGAEIASMVSYAVEKRRAKYPERFGKGAVEGLAGPESANNAGAIGSFIPLLSLGIPGSITTALLFGALVLHGITPGPELVEQSPGVFYGLIGSMYVGNLMLLVLNIPMIKVFAQMLRLRIGILSPIIVLVVMVGAFSLKNSPFDMGVLALFGVVGYLARKTGFSMGPLALAFILGPMMETAFRQSLLMAEGDITIFFTRPISASLFGIIVVTVLLQRLRVLRRSNRAH